MGNEPDMANSGTHETAELQLDGARIGAAIASFLLGSLVIRLISQGQTPVRILVECALIGAVVYLLTVVVRPPSARTRAALPDVAVESDSVQSSATLDSETVPEATKASISASDLPS